ncbi:MAG TPA: acyl-ACP desaturase [Mycobacterium sp.]|nr:acyl-ACP desaturase [Mycobacterium sp.]
MGSRADDPGKPPAHVVEMRTLGRLYCNRSAHVPPPGQHRGGAVAIGRQYVWRVPAPSLYRNLVAAALDVEPNTTMEAIAREVINFQMPGSSMPGFAENALTIAKAGIYDLRSHLNEVLRPVLRFWKVFDRKDFSDVGARARDDLAQFLELVESKASYYEQRRLERQDATAELGS